MRYHLILLVILAGCHSTSRQSPQSPGAPSSVAGAYVLSGPVSGAGPHPLHRGEKISSVISQIQSDNSIVSGTIVLVRRDPEGFRREMIQIAPNGHLMDPKQDYVLRDGDELVFPAQTPGKSGP